MKNKLISFSYLNRTSDEAIQQRINNISSNASLLLEHPIFESIKNIMDTLLKQDIHLECRIFGSTVYSVLANFNCIQTESVNSLASTLHKSLRDIDLILISNEKDTDLIMDALKSAGFNKHNDFTTIIENPNYDPTIRTNQGANPYNPYSQKSNQDFHQNVHSKKIKQKLGCHFASTFKQEKNSIDIGLSIIYSETYNPARHASSIAESLYISVSDDFKSVKIGSFLESPSIALYQYLEKILDHPGTEGMNLTFRVPKSEKKGFSLTKRMNSLVINSFHNTYCSYGLKSTALHTTLFRQVDALWKNYQKSQQDSKNTAKEKTNIHLIDDPLFSQTIIEPFLESMGYVMARLKKNNLDSFIYSQVGDRVIDVLTQFINSKSKQLSHEQKQRLIVSLDEQIEMDAMIQSDIPNITTKAPFSQQAKLSKSEQKVTDYKYFIKNQFKILSGHSNVYTESNFRTLFDAINKKRDTLSSIHINEFETIVVNQLLNILLEPTQLTHKEKSDIENFKKKINSLEPNPLFNSRSFSQFTVNILTIFMQNIETLPYAKNVLNGKLWSIAFLEASGNTQQSLIQLAKQLTLPGGNVAWLHFLTDAKISITNKTASKMIELQLSGCSNLPFMPANTKFLSEIVSKNNLDFLADETVIKKYVRIIKDTLDTQIESTLLEINEDIPADKELGILINVLRLTKQIWQKSENNEINNSLQQLKLKIIEIAQSKYNSFDSVIEFISLMEIFDELSQPEFLDIILPYIESNPGVLCDSIFWEKIDETETSSCITNILSKNIERYVPNNICYIESFKQCYKRAPNQDKSKLCIIIFTKRPDWLIKNNTEKTTRLPSIQLANDILQSNDDKKVFPNLINQILSSQMSLRIKLSWLFILSESYQSESKNSDGLWIIDSYLIEKALNEVSTLPEHKKVFIQFYESKNEHMQTKIINQIAIFLKICDSRSAINWKTSHFLYEFCAIQGNAEILSTLVTKKDYSTIKKCFSTGTPKIKRSILELILNSDEPLSTKLSFIKQHIDDEDIPYSVLSKNLLKLKIGPDETVSNWENYCSILNDSINQYMGYHINVWTKESGLDLEKISSTLPLLSLDIENIKHLILKATFENLETAWNVFVNVPNPIEMEKWIGICLDKNVLSSHKETLIKRIIEKHTSITETDKETWKYCWDKCTNLEMNLICPSKLGIDVSTYSDFIWKLENNEIKVKLITALYSQHSKQSKKNDSFLPKLIKATWEEAKEKGHIENAENTFSYLLNYYCSLQHKNPLLISLAENLDDETDSDLFKEINMTITNLTETSIAERLWSEKNSNGDDVCKYLVSNSKNRFLKETLRLRPNLSDPKHGDPPLEFLALQTLNSETLKIVLKHRKSHIDGTCLITSKMEKPLDPSLKLIKAKNKNSVQTPVGLVFMLFNLQQHIQKTPETSKKIKNMMFLLMDYSISLNRFEDGQPIITYFYQNLDTNSCLSLIDIFDHPNMQECVTFTYPIIKHISYVLQQSDTEQAIRISTKYLKWLEQQSLTKEGFPIGNLFVADQTYPRNTDTLLNQAFKLNNWENILLICRICRNYGMPPETITGSDTLEFYEPMRVFEKVPTLLPLKITNSESLEKYKNFIREFNIPLESGAPIYYAICGIKNKEVLSNLLSFFVSYNLDLNYGIRISQTNISNRVSRYLPISWMAMYCDSYDVFGPIYENKYPKAGRFNLTYDIKKSDNKEIEEEGANLLFAAIESAKTKNIDMLLNFICNSFGPQPPIEYFNTLHKLLIENHPIYNISAWKLIQAKFPSLYTKYKAKIKEICGLVFEKGRESAPDAFRFLKRASER
ncbi:hypothetical protein HOG98_05045 [bacterium]|jgi:hypothetical protein|nr:hypothetical protein [bacterium]